MVNYKNIRNPNNCQKAWVLFTCWRFMWRPTYGHILLVAVGLTTHCGYNWDTRFMWCFQKLCHLQDGHKEVQQPVLFVYRRYRLSPPFPDTLGMSQLVAMMNQLFWMTSVSAWMFVSICASIGMCMGYARCAQAHPNVSKFSILYHFLRSC